MHSESESRRPNRLAFEKSPYLLQHANNPVDWYPWGPEAFEKARVDDKPVLVSIGYSSCHWCHVMEKESFEDPEIAGLMNDAFVCIKVDREERPDIDSTYMTVSQLLTGSGGWPLHVVMTPEKKPFFAATYIPKESMFGQRGLKELIPQIRNLWASRRRELLDSAEKISSLLVEAGSRPKTQEQGELGKSVLNQAYRQLSERFDAVNGGFGLAPKFPSAHSLTFLLRYWKRTGNKNALTMVEETLRTMRLGGIFDQVGFGFHRYSTDPMWLVPHFEKMLYDQAMIGVAYTETYQATGSPDYGKTAQETFDFVLRELTSPGGGFYSGIDADSEGEEGKYYLWTKKDVRDALTEDESELACSLFNIAENGNFEESVRKKSKQNILHLDEALPVKAGRLSIPVGDLEARLEQIRLKLLAARDRRVRPSIDDKILTDWNGLMITALARGAQVYGRSDYLDAARKASAFVLSEMRDRQGRLLHRYRDGEAKINGFLDDYSYFISGLIELYETSFDVDYLEKALELNEDMINRFWDKEGGGFFFTPDDAENILGRTREERDGAYPSGNSIAALNLLRLARMTGRTDLEEKVSLTMRSLSRNVLGSPMAYSQLLSALAYAIGPSYEVVIVGKSSSQDTQTMLQALNSRFLPNKVVLLRPLGDEAAETRITRFSEFIGMLQTKEQKATAFVCRNHACELPTTDPDEMLRILK
ncbi:thioredoxin domain-containing protein [Candidatus Bathyarchaeota archaeon]|nr:thioredoxin domain-containing protein [Candidatus Bathyarchaeota archaeon]